MAIELITGRYGRAHIGSEDVRAYQAYTAGSGRYVLHGGGASVQSANNVHINPAEILIDGAHVRITGLGEDVSLENGASSYNRVDIVALHYLMTGSGDTAVESVTLEVVKGTPSELTPSDPEMPASGSILDNVSETYVPYVRVLIQGLTPQTPEVLLPSYMNPADIAGDGDQVNPSLLVNLGGTSADTIFKASPRPGVYGTLPASKGGTGQTSLQAARNAMGLGNTSGALPVANGGTGATTRASALGNLLRAGEVTGNFNNYTAPGIYSVNEAHDISNYPTAGGKACYKWGILQVIQGGSSDNIVQIYWPDSTGAQPYFRVTGWSGWRAWTRLATHSEIYPVGAVYISYVSTSPASLFGGTWTPITGRFPYFNAGTSTGGSNSYTLTISQMPSHSHNIHAFTPQDNNISGNNTNPTNGDSLAYWSSNDGHFTVKAGGGESHNNMPAYQTLYAWRRTA